MSKHCQLCFELLSLYVRTVPMVIDRLTFKTGEIGQTNAL